MPRPSWLRRKGKSKLGSLADPSRPSSPAVSSNSALGNDGVIAPENYPEAEQPKIESCRSLWDQAYDDLRIEKKDLVETFENMLISGHESNPIWNLGDGDPLKREKQMSALVDEKLAAMNDKRWRIKMCGRSVEIREQVDRVVKVVLVAKDFITPFANLDPVHAGLSWAGVCMLLQLVIKDSIQHTAAIDGLEYISRLVRRYTQIEHVYFQDEGFTLREDLEAAIKKLYIQILEYEARAACQFNRKTGHQMVRNIVEADSWDSILSSIRISEGECDKLMVLIDASDQQARMKQLEITLSQQTGKVNELLKASCAQDEALLAEIKAMRKDQKASFQTHREMDCHKCFRVVGYESTMKKNPDRVSGTCEWFLRHPRYISWLNGQASNLLWVTADPGCGKSVLSRFLVIDYKSWMWKDISICYFFFKDDSEENKSLTHALCSILHQLFEQNSALLKHAMPEFNSNGDKLSQLSESLWKILLRAAADPDNGGIVCILDALDECSASSCKQLVEHLAEFQSMADGTMKIKFLVTSRPNDLIWRTFSQHFFRHERDLASIQLMGENEEEMKEICAEINLLVHAKVHEFKKLRSRHGIEDDADVTVKAKLDEIENRTYLWIALIFPELEELAKNAEDDLLERIERIPSTVDEAYEKILFNSSDALQARRLLQIVCVASRPLTLAEMNRALSIQDRDHIKALMPEPAFGKFVRELCGLFVSIQNSSIYLIHQTAKEFLICKSAPEKTTSPTTSHKWKNSLELTESHHVLAQICMCYFFSSEFDSDPLDQKFSLRATFDNLEKHDFLSYAAQEWVPHFRRAGNKPGILSKLALEICNPQSRQYKTWYPVFRLDLNSRLNSPVYRSFPRKLTSLHVGSFLGLEEVVRLLLARDDINCDLKDGSGQTPLSWAAMSGHDHVMKLLLARDDVDPNSRNNKGRTPLHMAADQGQTQAVELLLAQDNVDPDSKDIENLTPLSRAAQCGNTDTIKLLLARDDVDSDSKDIKNQTPLSWAARFGNTDAIKLLLVRDDVDPDSKDIKNQTPLSWAARFGNTDAIKLLLVRDDVDPDSKDINNRTPLSWAAEKGNTDAIKLLLVRDDVDPDSKNINNRTPLSWAAEKGRVDAIKLLLARDDVDPDSKDINNRTPLSWAAEKGNTDAIKLLLVRDDVDPDSKDINNRTPLSWAAAGGLFGTIPETVKLLLARDDVDSDSKDINNRTPLSWAAAGGPVGTIPETVKLLLARDDVDPDSKDINNRTPLSWAAEEGNVDRIELLLARNEVDPDSKDINNRTPLSWAAERGIANVIKLLLARNEVDPDSKDINNRTPLSWAAAGGTFEKNPETVKLLLARDDVDPDSTDNDGRTPTWWAEIGGNFWIVELLLDARKAAIASQVDSLAK